MGKGNRVRKAREATTPGDTRPPGSLSARGGERGSVARPRRASRVMVSVALSTFLTTCLLYLLYTYQVPLGESGKFVYRYSKMLIPRLARGAALVPVMGVLAGALWMLGRERWRRAGLAVGMAGMLMLAAWTWWVPPSYLQQHAINLLSPSHEGAFVLEALGTPSAGEYVRRFDAERLPLSVEQLRGTRILSNTPGTTVLARWMMDLWPASVTEPGVFERHILAAETRPEDLPYVAYSMKFSVVLAALWGLSGLVAYGLGRQFLSPVGAGLFAVLVTFNPATANFVPGKDPAQLLTINAMLWAWFAGVRRRSAVWTAAAGGLLMLGMAWGLIHLWVAAGAWVATVGYSIRRWVSWGEMAVRFVVAPAVGAGALVGIVYGLSEWNMLGTFAAVARRYNEVQEWIKYDRGLWFVIGLPLFLLFVSPVVHAMVALSRGRWRWRKWMKKWYLLSVTMGVMGVIYVIGITYELPRLWVAFVPLLTLGAMAELAVFRGRDGRRAVGIAILLLIVNCVTTVMHVAALDARESEFRLFGGAGARLFE